jgi:hypothetical protein
MGKDLRTSAVSHKLMKLPKLDGSLWGLKQIQPFLPCYEKLFKTETLSNLSEYGMKLSDTIDSIESESSIRSRGKSIPVHRKTTMILSPFKWMRGDYGAVGLPKPESVANEMNQRIQSPHTAAYVGALTSLVLSESDCPHFPKVYGVYTAIASKHTIDISDDYEELSERHWFGNNIGVTFDLKLRTTDTDSDFRHTRKQRHEIVLGDDALLDNVEDVAADHVSEPETTSHSSEYEEDTEGVVDEDASDDSEDLFEISSCDCDSEEEDEEEDEEEMEPFAWAEFTDVPVVTTVLEKCEGTFYDLLQEHSEPEKHAAWVSQIVMALAYAQRNYGFVHNDLHGNNVMYVKTDQEFLYYKHGGVCYKIPTYGYLIKIIDFDRACMSLRLTGMKEPRHFVSSQFFPDEEACGQYNMDPFYDTQHPHIPSCSSFDLCRFATSMFWDMFPQGPKQDSQHPLFHVFLGWMKQSDGTSVMFREQMDNHDRYHGFHLYKAIARYCKDAVPRREIQKLTIYQVPSIPLGTKSLFIEN